MEKRILNNAFSEVFLELLQEVPEIGRKAHASVVIEHARLNTPFCEQTIKQIPKPVGKKAESAIVISAGPSIHRQGTLQKIRSAEYSGTIIAVDGSYVSCLKAGIVPDFVISVDPHKTRMVRWFGDPDFEENSKNDDYFARQDLDVDFRKNSIRSNLQNIELVNQHAARTRAILASSSPPNMVKRVLEAGFDSYWWNPLMDDPNSEDSFTRRVYALNKLPCMNTGGNVGTSAWIFALSILKIKRIALTGMDFGYYWDTPLKQTQTYYELVNRAGTDNGIEEFFTQIKNPLTGGLFYTDPVYAWYTKNFIDLHKEYPSETYNCTEGGTLVDQSLPCMFLRDFLQPSVSGL